MCRHCASPRALAATSTAQGFAALVLGAALAAPCSELGFTFYDSMILLAVLP